MTFSSTPEPFLKSMEKYDHKPKKTDPYKDGAYGTVKKKKAKLEKRSVTSLRTEKKGKIPRDRVSSVSLAFNGIELTSA